MSKRKPQHCYWCKRQLQSSQSKSTLRYTRDHIRPKTLGGTGTVACCFACNNLKGDMPQWMWVEFMAAHPNWTALLDQTNYRGVRLYTELVVHKSKRGQSQNLLS